MSWSFVVPARNGVVATARKGAGGWYAERWLPGISTNCVVMLGTDGPATLLVGTDDGVWRMDPPSSAGTDGRAEAGSTPRTDQRVHQKRDHAQPAGDWRTSGLAGWAVKSLAISPLEKDTVYAGTRPVGVFVSSDRGMTWRELAGFKDVPGRWWWFSPAELPYKAYVLGLAVSPEDPDTILAGVEFGAVVRSGDGGRTWTGHLSGAIRDCHDLRFHPRDGTMAYEAGGTGGGAACSEDGGRSWRQLGSGLAKHYGVACAADPVRPEVWYVSVAPSPRQAYGDRAEAYLYRRNGSG